MNMMKRLAQLYEEDTSDKIATISNNMIDKSVGYSEDDILYNNESDESEIVTVADRSNYRRPTTGKYNAKYHIAKKILKFDFTIAEQQIFWQLIRPFLNINIPGRHKNIKYDFIFAKIFNLMTISDDRRQYLISLCKPVLCKYVKQKYEEIYNSIIS